MAKCDQCGNEYDKVFHIAGRDATGPSTALSALFRCLPRHVLMAVAGSSGTAWRKAMLSTAVRTVPRKKARALSGFGPEGGVAAPGLAVKDEAAKLPSERTVGL